MVGLRKRGVLRAAELYAEACNRLSEFVKEAPAAPSSQWAEAFRAEYDKCLAEVEGAKMLLLMLARKL
jgi:hypothetical protein